MNKLTVVTQEMHDDEDKHIACAFAILEQRLRRPVGPAIRYESLCKYVRMRLLAQTRRVVYAAFLSGRGRMLWCGVLFGGDTQQCAFYPREVVVEALRRDANLVILGCNYLQSEAAPSPREVELVRRIAKGLNIMDVRLLDFLAVWPGAVTSILDMTR